MAGDVTSVHVRLQSFPQRWLRQLAARDASSLPKHKAEKNRGKEKVSLPSEPGARQQQVLDSRLSGGEHGAGAFIYRSVGPGTYRTIERSSVPPQWTWEGDCRG